MFNCLFETKGTFSRVDEGKHVDIIYLDGQSPARPFCDITSICQLLSLPLLEVTSLSREYNQKLRNRFFKQLVHHFKPHILGNMGKMLGLSHKSAMI